MAFPSESPQPLAVTSDILDATFVSRHPPDIERNAAVVGLCTVAPGREGHDDLGWHVADFMAFKALFAPYVNPRSQAWLSLVDATKVAEQRGYKHSGCSISDGLDAEKDDVAIHVESSADNLSIDFISQLAAKAKLAQENDDPLVIIVCGLTSLEQDVYFGDSDFKIAITSVQIRRAINADIRVIFVTPSLTSAGWQINPSFMRNLSSKDQTQAAGNAYDFRARQCGAIFAREIAMHFFNHGSPFILESEADPKKYSDRVGPVRLDEVQAKAGDNFAAEIHALAASRLLPDRGSHVFCFDDNSDPWQMLVGPRRGMKLVKMSEQWGKVSKSTAAGADSAQDIRTTNHVATDGLHDQAMVFLGGAFGGSKKSQKNHIKHLIKESFRCWPGYYATTFGEDLRKGLELFMHRDSNDDVDWHEMFNIMEHRLTLNVLGDMVTKNLGILSASNARCRDWDEAKSSKDMVKSQKTLYNQTFLEIKQALPPTQMPIIQNLRVHQAGLLLKDTNLQASGAAWFQSIGIASMFTANTKHTQTLSPKQTDQRAAHKVGSPVHSRIRSTESVLSPEAMPFVPLTESATNPSIPNESATDKNRLADAVAGHAGPARLSVEKSNKHATSIESSDETKENVPMTLQSQTEHATNAPVPQLSKQVEDRSSEAWVPPHLRPLVPKALEPARNHSPLPHERTGHAHATVDQTTAQAPASVAPVSESPSTPRSRVGEHHVPTENRNLPPHLRRAPTQSSPVIKYR
ncbi:hypothetical protein JX266_010108 [Neoarthrinium moseri]|nr:hypothetical protein JX266_010108 [Neoarthrinium moseri]